MQESHIDTILEKCDDTEQYTRRHSVRINCIPVKKSGENKDIHKIVESCYSHIGLQYDRNAINRAHHVGKVMTNRATKKKTQSIIVQFSKWEDRCKFYKN